MRVLEIKPDDFTNFRDPLGYPSLFIGMGTCDWKCCIEAGLNTSVCQNYELAHAAPRKINAQDLLAEHLGTARSVVVGGLEPLNDMNGLLELASAFSGVDVQHRSWMPDDEDSGMMAKAGFPKIFVLYTGYNEDERPKDIADVRYNLGDNVAFIVKYGRFVPGKEKRFDTILGVELASPNQYAKIICSGLPKIENQMHLTSDLYALKSTRKKQDAVDHPTHYKSRGIEAIDVIRAFDLNFSLGNAVKYILRAGRKDKKKEVEDLEKAAWYLNEEIKWRTPVECAKLETGSSEVPSTGS